jgi:hypothetical protein
MSRVVCLIALLCALGAAGAAPQVHAQEAREAAATRHAGTVVNLFETLDPQSPIDGALLELPRDWTVKDVHLLQYGTKPVPVQRRSGTDDTVVLTTASPIQGPHELVVRVQTDPQPGMHRWHLTPFDLSTTVTSSDTARERRFHNADRLTRRIDLEPPPQPDGTNRALSLAAADDALQIQLPASLAPSGDRSFTIEFWMRTSGLNQVPLSSWTGEETTAYPFEFIVDRSGHLRLYCGQSGRHEALRTNTPVADGDWHHVAAVYDETASRLRLLLDGTRVDSLRPQALPTISGKLPVALGGRRPLPMTEDVNQRLYTGRLDEVRFWPTARSTSTIRRLRTRPFAGRGTAAQDAPFRLSFDGEASIAPIEDVRGAEQVPTSLTFRAPLRRLRASTDGESVTLRWTAQSTDRGTFIVERSLNGRSFTEIERLSPLGADPLSSPQAREVTYTDKNVPEDVVFYRVRHTAPNAKTERTTRTIKIGLGGPDASSPPVKLIGNFPNPFRTSTTVTYRVKESQPITLTVWDLSGKQITTLADAVHEPGYYEQTLDASDLPSGPYFVRLQTPQGIQSHRMILLK